MAKDRNTSIDIEGGRPDIDVYTNDGDASDFRDVPASDSPRRPYQDRGLAGTFASNGGRRWGAPEGVRFDYERDYHGCAVVDGADADCLKRGYIKPVIDERPGFQKSDYALRRSLPSISNDDDGDTNDFAADRDFKSRNMRARGFFTRQRIPTER